MKRGAGPGHRDRAHPRGRVHSGRVHERHHRAPLSAVRAHDRDLGAHLGVQRAHAEPGAERAAAPAARASARASLRRARGAASIAGSAARRTATSRSTGSSFASSSSRSFSSPASRRVSVLLGRKLPSGFVPDEDQGYAIIGVQLPDGASLQRTKAVYDEDRRDPREAAGHPHLQRRRRLQLLHAHRGELHGHGLHRLQAVGRAQDAGADVRRRSSKSLNARVRAHSGGARLRRRRRRPSPASAPPGGFSMMLQDRSGGTYEFLAQNVGKFMAEARKRPELAGRAPELLARGAAALRRRRQGQGAQGGRRRSPRSTTRCRRSSAARTSTTSRASGASGASSCRPSRAFERAPTTSGSFYVRNARGEMVPLSSFVRMRHDGRARVHGALQSVSRPSRSWARRRPATAPVRRSTRSRRSRRRRCRRRWATRGTRSRTRRRSRRAGSARVLGLSLVFVFLILAALYESWSLPVQRAPEHAGRRARRVPRALVASLRQQRLRADRPRHARRAHGEERDPDRRVREGQARGRAGRSSTRRSRARGCACGRS